jgi:hypothetical protein
MNVKVDGVFESTLRGPGRFAGASKRAAQGATTNQSPPG